MLKKSLFSPAQSPRAKTCFSTSVALAWLRDLTYRVEPLGYLNHRRGLSVRQDPSKGRTVHARCGLYLLAILLAAALLPERRVLARGDWAGENRGIFVHAAECHTRTDLFRRLLMGNTMRSCGRACLLHQ